MEATGQAGSLSDIPAEHRMPRKRDIFAKVAAGLKGSKDVHVVREKQTRGLIKSQSDLKGSSMSSQGSLLSRSTDMSTRSMTNEVKSQASDRLQKSIKSDKVLKSKKLSGRDLKDEKLNAKDLKSKKPVDKDLKNKKPSDKDVKNKKPKDTKDKKAKR